MARDCIIMSSFVFILVRRLNRTFNQNQWNWTELSFPDGGMRGMREGRLIFSVRSPVCHGRTLLLVAIPFLVPDKPKNRLDLNFSHGSWRLPIIHSLPKQKKISRIFISLLLHSLHARTTADPQESPFPSALLIRLRRRTPSIFFWQMCGGRMGRALRLGFRF